MFFCKTLDKLFVEKNFPRFSQGLFPFKMHYPKIKFKLEVLVIQ